MANLELWANLAWFLATSFHLTTEVHFNIVHLIVLFYTFRCRSRFPASKKNSTNYAYSCSSSLIVLSSIRGNQFHDSVRQDVVRNGKNRSRFHSESSYEIYLISSSIWKSNTDDNGWILWPKDLKFLVTHLWNVPVTFFERSCNWILILMTSDSVTIFVHFIWVESPEFDFFPSEFQFFRLKFCFDVFGSKGFLEKKRWNFEFWVFIFWVFIFNFYLSFIFHIKKKRGGGCENRRTRNSISKIQNLSQNFPTNKI